MKKTMLITSLSFSFLHFTASAEGADIAKAKVINIEAPLKNNISFNTFESLSSNEDGLIFNNDINSNNKLNNKAAKLIFAEVTGTEESQIQGILGIKGQRANLVIANPNGITWKDGTISNINSLSLVAGKFEKKYIKNKDNNNQLEPQQLEDYNQLKFSVQPASQISISQQQGNPIQLSKLNLFSDRIKLQNTLNISTAMQNYISASVVERFHQVKVLLNIVRNSKQMFLIFKGIRLKSVNKLNLQGTQLHLKVTNINVKTVFFAHKIKLIFTGLSRQ